MPISKEIKTAINPTERLINIPAIIRLRRSRPNLSGPNQNVFFTISSFSILVFASAALSCGTIFFKGSFFLITKPEGLNSE
jgi:hypothetical protein